MKGTKKMRLAVDANIWISSLLKQTFQDRTEIFFDSENIVMVSKELFDDLEDAIQKPYLAKRISRKLYEKLVTRLRKNAELVDVHSVVKVCRDSNDNFLLALAKDGNADYLITGDDDLLVLKTFGNTRIVTLTDFETVVS